MIPSSVKLHRDALRNLLVERGYGPFATNSDTEIVYDFGKERISINLKPEQRNTTDAPNWNELVVYIQWTRNNRSYERRLGLLSSRTITNELCRILDGPKRNRRRERKLELLEQKLDERGYWPLGWCKWHAWDKWSRESREDCWDQALYYQFGHADEYELRVKITVELEGDDEIVYVRVSNQTRKLGSASDETVFDELCRVLDKYPSQLLRAHRKNIDRQRKNIDYWRRELERREAEESGGT